MFRMHCLRRRRAYGAGAGDVGRRRAVRRNLMTGPAKTFEVGQAANWHKVVSAYGHVDVIPVVIKKIGPQKITVEVPLKDGGTRLVAVKPENLRPAAVSP
jgi:hypothetical protein